MINSNHDSPTFVFDDLKLNWLMSRSEKFAFYSLLESIKPEVAIEIGTFEGGSLQVISKHAQKVYSIDISKNLHDRLRKNFNNVKFLTGDSKIILPELLQELNKNEDNLGFILIDGDHSKNGVMADINSVLNYKPLIPLYILLHDSFYPICRQGMLEADWAGSKYVHYVEIDFIPGVFFHKQSNTVKPGSMYGGYCLVKMLPEVRKEELLIHQSQQGLYECAFEKSIYIAKEETKIKTVRYLKNLIKKLGYTK